MIPDARNTAAAPADRGLAVLFAGSVFLGAFLLFQVQPVIGKFILPWFGSSPAVWTTCMLFFQVLLLGGYAYAHVLVRLRSRAMQGVIHGVMLATAMLLLPITPEAVDLPEAAGADPTWGILALLTTSVGLPYLVLSATGPLLLGWRSMMAPDRPAYRLYALSNAGSLLALLSYPFVFEPVLRLEQQTGAWSVGFGVFAVVCAGCAVAVGRRSASSAHGGTAKTGLEVAAAGQPSAADLVLWVALAACGSALLLATTNQLCLDVAVVPFLWVVPLSLYLVTFILCFDHPRWYHRGVFGTLLPLAGAVAFYLISAGVNLGLTAQIVGYSAVLFVGCMCSHGELVRAKPDPRHLTLFFLSVSLGGAVGGIAVALAAPAVFSSIVEFHVAVVMAMGLMLVATWRQRVLGGRLAACALLGWLGFVALFAWKGLDVGDNVQARERNFYGVLSVRQTRSENGQVGRTSLSHGRIHHGNQYGDEPGWPNSYYGPLSGVGLAVRRHPQRTERALRLGVVGLGAGTMAAYASAQVEPFAEGVAATEEVDDEDLVRRLEPRSHADYLRFYEINPLVIDWADRWFSFLGDARARGADVDVVAGDARLAMQGQLARGHAQAFDVLAIDAFTGDAIPIHLLTAECLQVYWQHLADDGVLAVHVSNRFIDLVPVVHRHGVAAGKGVLVVDDDERDALRSHGSVWVLVTSNRALLEDPVLDARSERLLPSECEGPLWTDDYSSVATLLK